MKRKIIPLPDFDRDVENLIKRRKLIREDYDEFKRALTKNPEMGAIITGTGGVRKTRLKSASKGKRGGFRVLYYDDEDREELFLMVIYPKNEKDDISPEEKKCSKNTQMCLRGENMGKIFESLKKGFEDIIAYREGKLTLKSEFIEIPEPPKSYSVKEIKRLRQSCNYSQALFAKFLNVSVKTVQAWETGERVPNHAALRLLELIDKGVYLPAIQHQKESEKQRSRKRSRTAMAA